MRTLKPLLACLLLATLGGLPAGEVLTYPELVRRLTDLEALAVLPAPGEKSEMASSYDRASRYDAAADRYVEWDRNGDGKGVIRQDGDEAVLADIQGPGCIWRIWSALADQGHVQIFLDGAATPAVDLPFRTYFDAKSGPFAWPDLAYSAAGDEARGEAYVPGLNLYVPIPFQKSCRIIGRKGWGQYFHFNYTRYPAGTVLPTFSLATLTEHRAALDEAQRTVADLAAIGRRTRPGQERLAREFSVPAGGSQVAGEITGERAITALTCKLALPADPEAQRLLLRRLTIAITWDDEAAPAVWAPLSDFFACIGGTAPFRTLPAGLLADGTFFCNWYMPFARKARIVIGNDGPDAVALACEVTHAPLTRPLAELGRFHAKWHRDAAQPMREDRKPDWSLLSTSGRGRFVGVHLHLWNPIQGWWGEGDEKFFVDGEKFPSTYGTGSEDYFGYAWSSGLRFIRPFHCQAQGSNNMGHASDTRWHIGDNLPFHSGFEAAIEKYYPNPGANPYERNATYAATVFWYLAPGGTDPYQAVPVGQRAGYWTLPPVTFVEPGVIEGEDLVLVKPALFQHYPGAVGMWSAGLRTWSGDKQLTWGTDRGGNSGEAIELRLPVATAGTYRLDFRLTRSPDGGTFQFALDGEKLGEPVDLFAAKTAPTEVLPLGTRTLSAGEHVLKVGIVGVHAGNRVGMVGIDYIKLVPVPSP